MPDIHVSDAKQFLRCRLLWDFTSPLRQNLEPNWPPHQLFIGSAIHYALDARYRYGPAAVIPAFADWVTKGVAALAPETQTGPRWEKMLQQVDTADKVLRHYNLWAPAADQDWTWLAGEYTHQCDFPLPEPIRMLAPSEIPTLCEMPRVRYVMRADGLVEKDGEAWVVEWKTCTTFPDTDELWRDIQNAMYVMALQYNPPPILHGLPVVGTVYTFLRKKAPAEPKTLKDGTLSKAAIDTSAEAYRAYLSYQQISPLWYGDILSALAQGEHNFFRRVWVRRPQASLTYALENLLAVARDMIDPNVVIYPAPDWFRCRFCSFSIPCILLHNRQDITPNLRADYKEGTKRPHFAYHVPEEDET